MNFFVCLYAPIIQKNKKKKKEKEEKNDKDDDGEQSSTECLFLLHHAQKLFLFYVHFR